VNTASLALCKELYELSGWIEVTYEHELVNGESYTTTLPVKEMEHGDRNTYIPAYDLGFLLEKLPQNSWVGYVDTSGQRGYALAKTYAWNEKGTDIDRIVQCSADIPEDAACKLAIELFARGILKRQSMDFDTLRTLPATTAEEFDQIQEGILALAGMRKTEYYTWEEKVESLVKLAKRVDTFFTSREGVNSLDKIPGLFLVRLASDEVGEWWHDKPNVVDEIKALLQQYEVSPLTGQVIRSVQDREEETQ